MSRELALLPGVGALLVVDVHLSKGIIRDGLGEVATLVGDDVVPPR